VNATGTKLERAASIEAQTLATVRQLLVELGGSRGLEELAARGATAHLERELGLGSLERVELMVRLGNVCGVRLPDRVVAEAETVQDLADALLRDNSGESTGATIPSAAIEGTAPAAAVVSRSPAQIADLEQKISSAESLTEILRLRGLCQVID
jgi:acyl carrier protein